MLDLISSALSNLKGKLARTILTLLGVAIGVSSVIIVSSISETGTNVLMNEFDSLGLSGLTISTDVNPVSYTHLDVYKRQRSCCTDRYLWYYGSQGIFA